ncbi:MFS transporter [Sunxiuqinia sp. A32]|uniref:MFS transporter n=1 Tax=Sunxiuqinia sp. A32 TaxID=3461496 RepID=UPI004045708F
MSGNQSIFKSRSLYIIFSTTLVAVMGVASITPAFPTIIKYFDITAQQVGWLIASFTLPGIFLTPVTGVLADRLGRKIILVPSLFIFGIAGLSCAFIRDYEWLLVLRFVQGVGASSLASINITLIGDMFSGEQRTSAMGYNASVLSIGTASYPAIGGLLTVFGWSYVFVLPVLAIPLGIWVIYGLNNPEPQNHRGLKEYFGNVWRTINRPIVWGLFFANILLFVILYGAYLTYFPLLLENRFEADSVIIGGTMSLMSMVTALTSSQLFRINKVIAPRQQLMISTGLYFLSMLFLAFTMGWEGTLIAIVLFGLGHGILIPSIQNMLVGLASIQERAAFMSLNAMVLRVGQTVGPLLIGIFYALGGISSAFIAGAGAAVLMFLLIVILVRPAKEV